MDTIEEGMRKELDLINRFLEEQANIDIAAVDKCLIAEFFKNNPKESAAYISCPCPKCTPRY